MIRRKKVVCEVPPCATDFIPTEKQSKLLSLQEVRKREARLHSDREDPAGTWGIESQPASPPPTTPPPRMPRVEYNFSARVPFLNKDGENDELVVEKHVEGKTHILHRGKILRVGNLDTAMNMIERQDLTPHDLPVRGVTINPKAGIDKSVGPPLPRTQRPASDKIRYGFPVEIEFENRDGKPDKLSVVRHKYGQTHIWYRDKLLCLGDIDRANRMIENGTL